MPSDPSKRPLPKPTPETEHFWEGTRQQQLRLQRCNSCNETYFPPRPFCPKCSSKDIKVFAASGNGVLHSYIINHRPHPAFDGPYSIAVVKLAEGPQLMTNIVGCDQTPEALLLDMPVQVVFEKLNDDITLPLFTPATGA